MTLAQLEERLTALEKTVEELRLQRTASSPEEGANKVANLPPDKDDEFIPGVEYSFIVTVPPREEWHIVGKIVGVDPAPPGLGLSDAEWESLGLEDEDE